MNKNSTSFKKNLLLRLLPVLLVLLSSTIIFGQSLHVVEVRNTVFDPASLEVVAGDTVEWRNVEGYHNVNGTQVTFPSNPAAFGNSAGNGWTYQYIFTDAGSYSYQCDPHAALGMTGTISVQGEDGNGDRFMVSVDFSGMNPHVGQNIYLAVREAGSGTEVGRTHAVADTEFTLMVPGIETGMSYHVDFWVDFNENGQYDSPPVDHAWRLELNDAMGDTTLMFAHNTNFTNIMWENLLTVEFTGMNPHVGQDIYLAVTDNNSGMEVGRTHAIADTAFSLMVPGIEDGMSYNVDFWVDFNENGMYDAPSTDHAWRLELNDAMGDTTLMFAHNTSFTDIMWKNLLTVEFTGMNPHVGQDIYLSVTDAGSGMEVGRTHAMADTSFTLMVPGIEQGNSYHVDFWVDFNENGMYDAPPTDHAWRLELNDVMGDTTLMFAHNTDFTDIMWKNSLTVEFTGMNPHVGQHIYLAVVDTSSGMEVGRTHAIADTAFSMMTGIESGKSYHVDFWVDFNENGMYDAPPTDHAWRLELNDVMGDTTLMFAHNTNFTDIMWKSMLTVEFTGMNPHVGQDIYLAVVDMSSGTEVGRTHTVGETDFTLMVPGIETGKSYYVDFWADHNRNGMYDAPPTDHAWRLGLNDVMGDTTLMFAHNTNFTDIMWKSMLTVEFAGMNPHVGQNIYLAVVDSSSGMEVGRTHAVADTAFSMMVSGIESGHSYHVDFWVDFNENGMYDAPPTDHAWRLELNNVMGDTTLMFAHNTNFTDIMWKNMLTVEFTGMNPHVGQDLYLAVVDTASGMEIGRRHMMADTAFTIMVPGIETGMSYLIDFWVDFNENGMYDTPPTDHAWRLELNDVMGDTTLMFAHNTDFTDIMWQNMLTVEFTGMTPHVGQMLKLYVVSADDETVVDSVTVEEITGPDFTVQSTSISSGGNYFINFYADFNDNGMYDAPPTDHAWQLELDNVTGDTTLMFAHNTDFTDIFPVTSVHKIGNVLFRMYPNPATDVVFIESDALISSEYTLSVYDISGRLNAVELVTRNNRLEFSTRNLTKGIYFVELKSMKDRTIMKLIKQ